jgi:hypothetical protein
MNAMLWIKDTYWMHRDAARLAGLALGLFGGQTLMALWTARRLAELGHIRERMSRLADGLALLTDTTEAGLSAIAREVEQFNRHKTPPRQGTRTTVSKRVVAAARAGDDVVRIAEDEALSESEVRLHLTLAEANARDLRRAAGMRA